MFHIVQWYWEPSKQLLKTIKTVVRQADQILVFNDFKKLNILLHFWMYALCNTKTIL